MLGTAVSLLSHTKNKRTKITAVCARTAGGIHKTAGKKKGILLLRGSRGERVQSSPTRGQTLAPHTGVPSPCSTNTTNHCKEKILLCDPAKDTSPSRGVTLRVWAVQDRESSTKGPGKAAAAGTEGGVQGMRKNQLPAWSRANSLP